MEAGFKEEATGHKHRELAAAHGDALEVKQLRNVCARVEENSLWCRILRFFRLGPKPIEEKPLAHDDHPNKPIAAIEFEMPTRTEIATTKARITNTRLTALESYLETGVRAVDDQAEGQEQEI